MAVIRTQGITRIYTSLDVWKEKLCFRFPMELFPELGRMQGLVVGDAASWIKASGMIPSFN